MIDIDWNSVLVTGATYIVGFGAGLAIIGVACSKLGRYLAHARETQTTAVIPESPEEIFLFSGLPNYSALRNRTKQLQADEAARLV